MKADGKSVSADVKVLPNKALCLVCIGAKNMTEAFEKKKQSFIILGLTYKETGDTALICLLDPEFRVGF